MYQLEEHVTYLVCEVELNKKKKKKKKFIQRPDPWHLDNKEDMTCYFQNMIVNRLSKSCKKNIHANIFSKRHHVTGVPPSIILTLP